MGMQNECFNCVHSNDIPNLLNIKVGSLEGKRDKPDYKKLLNEPELQYAGCNQECSDLSVECRVFGNEKFLTLPIITSYKSFTKRWNWNEWLKFPIQYCNLPKDSKLLINIYDSEGPRKKVIVGGTCVKLFDKYGVFPRGSVDLRLWPGQEADAVKTPGLGTLSNEKNDEMYRLNKLVKRHESEQVPRVDWLDRLVFREIEIINDKQKKSSNFMYLMIEFPKIEIRNTYYHIIWWENPIQSESNLLNKYYKDMVLYDPEMGLENLHESKHHHLARSLQSAVTDRDLKPNSTNRDILLNIIEYPPTRQLSSDEQDLVWKYRYFLSQQKKGLTKFLKCVNWNLKQEAEQALSVMSEWVTPDPQDALELLGPDFANSDVRKYAVKCLNQATDNELLLYLTQLVQALKYEVWEVKELNLLDFSHYSVDSNQDLGAMIQPLETVVLKTASDDCNLDFDSKFRENKYESKLNETNSDTKVSKIPSQMFQNRQSSDIILEGSPFGNSDQDLNIHLQYTILRPFNELTSPLDLASFLIKRACKNSVLASFLYWYLLVECEEIKSNSDQRSEPESRIRDMYIWVLNAFKTTLQQYSAQSRLTYNTILRQQQFVDTLVSIVQTVNKETGGRLKKTEKLQSLLADPESKLSDFTSLPLPLNPEVEVCGIIPEKTTLFKSTQEPIKLTFKTTSNSEYIAIFKTGDDLRQDQLIVQMITLMDSLLLNENMDLKLTPYKVLATSCCHGFVQYVDSLTVAEVLRTEGSIQNYFRSTAPCENALYGISPQVLDTFVRSCAGYCIITYILSIGDRHFDNLLLTKEGHLFHIDFGYILGRDPKPLPPPMKLTKEMVDCMGGQNSELYNEFKRLCYTTFMQLRRHSALILHLFGLMVDASVPDIALEPDKTAKKIEDRFCPNLTEEEAIAHIQGVIEASVGAVVAVVVEQFHRFAQYIRK